MTKNRAVCLLGLLAVATWFTTGVFTILTADAQVAPSTEVGGTITADTVWTAANSPYILTETVTIVPGVTLTVEADVVVMGQNDTLLNVEGHLEAAGSASNPITFTSTANSAPGQWNGILVEGTAHLNNTIIRYGVVAVNMTSSARQVLIENAELSNSADYPLRVDVEALHQLQMVNVTFSENDYERVFIEAQADHDTLIDNVMLTAQLGLEGYVISYPIKVPSGTTLTLEPGTTVMATAPGYAVISVLEQGHLEASGTAELPIIFTSANSLIPGAWTSISILGSAHLEHAIFRYGQINLDIIGASGGLVTIENTLISKSSGYGLSVETDALHRLQMNKVTFINNNRNRVLIATPGNNYVLSDNAILAAQPGLEGYEIEDNFVFQVTASATLTLEQGVTLMAPDHEGFVIQVLDRGHLEAAGTAESPVTFTSASDSAPGEWTGLVIAGDATAHLHHTTVRNGRINLGLWGPSSEAVIIENSTFSHSELYPILVGTDGLHRLQMSNVTFRDNSSNYILIETFGGNNTLLHNTYLSSQPGLEGYEIFDGESPPRPYDLVIPAGITMTLDPGVTLIAQNYTSIQIDGHLEAIGTAGYPITFTSIDDSGPGEWAGLVLEGGTAHLEHIIIRNAGYDDHANINVNNTAAGGQLLIKNSEVVNSAADGLRVVNGQVTAVCTTFANNQVDGIHVSSGGAPTVTVTRSNISNNGDEGMDNNSATQVDARYNWWGDASGPAGDGPGEGDAVSGNVLYTPWLPKADCGQFPFGAYLPLVTGP